MSIVNTLSLKSNRQIKIDRVNLLSENNRQTTPVTCLRFDNCLYYIRFFVSLQSPYIVF